VGDYISAGKAALLLSRVSDRQGARKLLIDNAAKGALIARASVYAEHGNQRCDYDVPSTFWREEHAADGRHEVAGERRFTEANWMLSNFKLMWAAREFDMYDLREGLCDGICSAASIVSFSMAAVDLLLESIEACLDVTGWPSPETEIEPRVQAEMPPPRGGPISGETRFSAFARSVWNDRGYTEQRLRQTARSEDYSLSNNGFERVMAEVRSLLGPRPAGRRRIVKQ
jgi:hypothetical protein